MAFFVTAFLVLYFMTSGRQVGLLTFGDIEVIKIEGAIFDSSPVIKKLHDLQKNKSIKAVVVRIDSPGGAVAPSQEIYEELKKLKATKKIVVSMGTLAASGGYYIACVADKIVASPGTITGSIGVIMESFGFDRLLEWAHVESRTIKTGSYKDVGSPFRPMTLEDKTYLEGILNSMYSQFTKAVSEQRKIPEEKMRYLAEGRIFTGQQALENGLIDQLGTIYDAIEEAKKIAGLPANARVIWPREAFGPLDYLFGESRLTKSVETWLKTYSNNFQFPLWMTMTQTYQ